MTKQPNPHRLRRSTIKGAFLLILLAAALVFWLTGCTTPKYGCKGNYYFSGYHPQNK